MARALITETTNDLISDAGAILWSIVIGEQLEFPITLNFIENMPLTGIETYEYEAVVIEGDNVAEQSERPTTIKPNGAQTKLVIRVPVYVGYWNPPEAYNREEVVLYNNKYYKLRSGISRVSSIPPDQDPLWEETLYNIIYLQFPKTLGADWEISPTTEVPVYGFFELRVTEPLDAVFTRTWKPIRGMVQLLFSPTHIVPD